MSEALTLAEAVPLGYAVLARVAQDAGVRMLAIKGPILAMQGLRDPRQSVDIDVLVDPCGFAALTAGLEAIGWRDVSVYGRPCLVPKHSVNHRHPRWPCEVDVHHWFPGFLADPGATFDLFWERRTTVDIADQSLPALDAVAHGALAALHYLRDEGRSLRSADLEELAVVMETHWTAEQRGDLVALAAATGAAEPLAPLLRSLGLGVPEASVPLAVSLYDWRLRSQSRAPGVLPWLVELRRSDWRRRPSVLWRALWPDARQLHGVDLADPPRGIELRRLRLERIARGARALPAAWADHRRLRGDVRG